MSAPKDLDRQIESFLADGPMELPEPSYAQVRDRMETTRQRADFGLWRTSLMNQNLKYGLAVAAGVVVVIVGYQLLGGSHIGQPGPSASVAPSEAAQPTPSAPTSAEPSAPADGSLPVGSTFVLSNAPGEVAITIKIAGPGWFGAEGGGMIANNPNFDPPAGVALMAFQLPVYVYGDPCHWSTTTPATPVTTAAEFIAALEAQTSGDAADQHRGWRITDGFGEEVLLHVPGEAAVAACDQGQFRSWTTDPQQEPDARFSQRPGQIHDLWVGEAQPGRDWGGAVVVFDVARYPADPSASVDSEAIANALWDEMLIPTATFEKP